MRSVDKMSLASIVHTSRSYSDGVNTLNAFTKLEPLSVVVLITLL